MTGPLLGILGQAVGGMLAQQVGSGLGTLAVGGAERLRHRAAAGRAPAGPRCVPANVAAFAEGLDVSEDDVLLYLALREAAHQRLFAHVPWLRDHLIGAVADYARGIEINAEGIQSAHRGADARHRPDQPRVDAAAARGRAVRPAALPRPGGRAPAPRGDARAGRGLGGRGRRPGHRRADAGRRASCRRRSAAGAPRAAPPSRRSPRWSGSSCVRGGCATPPRCGARCGPARAPRPATASGCTPTCCPPRPTSTTRSASARTPPRRRALSDEDFDAELKKLLERRVSLHADALSLLEGWPASARRAGAAPAAVRRAPPRTPGRADPRLPARPPHRQHAGAERRRRRACSSPCTRRPGGGSSSAATASRATAPWPARRCARRPRSPAWPTPRLDPVPVQLSEHAVPFCGPDAGRAPPRRPLRRRRATGSRARRQRGVPRRALVAGPTRPSPAPGDPRARIRFAGRSRLPGLVLRRRRRPTRVRPSDSPARRRSLERGRARGRPADAGSPWPARPAGSGPPSAQNRVVAGLEQVRELVDQHVVDDPLRHPLQPRREPDGAVARRAGAPPGLLVVDPAHRLGRRQPAEVAVAERPGPGCSRSASDWAGGGARTSPAGRASSRPTRPPPARQSEAGIITTMRSPSR